MRKQQTGNTPGRLAQRARTNESARFVARMISQGWSYSDIASGCGYSKGNIALLLRRLPERPVKGSQCIKPPAFTPENKLAMWKQRVKARILECRTSDDECWPWKSYCFHPHADYPNIIYGRINMQHRGVNYQYAHRASYILFKGDIPEGMTVDHICHNTLCVNPAHLQLLSRSENAARKAPDHRERMANRTIAPKCKDVASRTKRILVLRAARKTTQEIAKMLGCTAAVVRYTVYQEKRKSAEKRRIA